MLRIIMQNERLPVSGHYQAERGRRYQSRFGPEAFGRRYQADLYFRRHVAASDTVLDFGCNDGVFLRWIDAGRRIGVEVNPAAREECEAACLKEGIRIELHDDIGSIEDGIVDVVISNHCLEHTLTPYETLRQIHRVLRPGGKLVLVLPFDDWRSPIHRRWRPGDRDNHLFTWSPMNAGNLLTEAGFRVESAEHTQIAITRKLKPARDLFGDRTFLFAAGMLSRYRRRSEVYAVAYKG